jgi:lipid-A-disaccharide synthase
MKEVRMNLPVILESAVRLGPGYDFLLPVAPTLDRSFLQSLIQQSAIQQSVTADNLEVRLVPETLPALAQSRAGIVASGTATVEAAMMGTPFVMVYRVSPLTYAVGRPRVKVPYFAMVNLIAGEEVVPELVQQDFTAENVATRLNEILVDGPARSKMITGLHEVKARLSGPTERGSHPVDQAARAVMSVWEAAGVSKSR